MGYTTEFNGSFKITPPLTDERRKYLTKFSETRRMARKLGPEFGVEGEYYVDGGGFMGQDHDASVINYNNPPKTQPGLWCSWVPNEDGTELEWNGSEKFYSYTEWLEYIVLNFLKPGGYSLNGEVTWQGEDRDDIGKIIVKDNNVETKEGKITYQ
jgi:hypothetical protein